MKIPFYRLEDAQGNMDYTIDADDSVYIVGHDSQGKYQYYEGKPHKAFAWAASHGMKLTRAFVGIDETTLDYKEPPTIHP